MVEIEANFDLGNNANPFEELMMHLQLDDNADDVYITNFNHVSLGGAILGYFVGGLRLEIQLRVQTFNRQNRVIGREKVGNMSRTIELTKKEEFMVCSLSLEDKYCFCRERQ